MNAELVVMFVNKDGDVVHRYTTTTDDDNIFTNAKMHAGVLYSLASVFFGDYTNIITYKEAEKMFDKKVITVFRESSDWRLSRNGGDYSFYEEKFYLGSELVHTRLTTSAEFPYCGLCGTFGTCWCEQDDPEWHQLDRQTWLYEIDHEGEYEVVYEQAEQEVLS